MQCVQPYSTRYVYVGQVKITHTVDSIGKQFALLLRILAFTCGFEHEPTTYEDLASTGLCNPKRGGEMVFCNK